MLLSIIVAIDENYGIGKDNQLMWHLPNDLKFFKNKTMGHHIIMGRKTYESIGKLLPGRTSVIVTHNKDYKIEGAIVVHSMHEAIQVCKERGETEAFAIGGAAIINEAAKCGDKIYLTEVKEKFDADVYLKEFNRADWKEINREAHTKDDKHAYDYDFVELVRK